jgi:hypothetical protein
MRIFAITVSHNEEFFLPRWVAWYGSQIGYENLFVVNHGSNDLSCAALGAANILAVPREKHNDEQRASFVSKLHSALLSYYDIGFATDVDEFVVADPRSFRSLPDFVESSNLDSLNGIGLELLHLPDRESSFRTHLPILSQRRHVYFSTAMCKPCLSRLPTQFGGGFHSSTNPVAFNKSFYLFHLKHFDYDWRLVRQRITRGWEYSGDFGRHARLDDSASKSFVDGLNSRFGRDICEGFDFAAECDEALSVVERGPEGRYYFSRAFFGKYSRVIPDEFMTLF